MAAHGSNSAGCRRRVALTASRIGPSFSTLCRPEQTSGSQEKDKEHRSVDEEGAELRRQHFAGGIADAEQQCGGKGAEDRAEPPHGHDDEEVDKLLHRISRRYGDDVGTKAAAERRKAAAKSKHQHEKAIGI